MNRLPLADARPYAFVPPNLGAFWLWLGRLYARHVYLPKDQQVSEVEVRGLEHLTPLLREGDGILITPNHPDHADASVMLETGRRAGRPFYFMAAYQVFQENGALARFMFPRIGAFPVDREGSDLKAFKMGVEIVAAGKAPLVIFPEGEIYHLCDRLTPIREGAAAVATTAAKRAAERGKTVWIVPVALKYRFLDGHDPLPALRLAMDRLESRFTWWPRRESALIERIYAYAEAMLELKELEYFGATRPGAIKGRIVALRDAILDALEDRLLGKRRSDAVPVRVKEIRHACLERLADPATSPAQAQALRRDLDDAFVAIQLFSYPGDYLRDGATVERIAETVMKFEQDVIGEEPAPRAPRRAIVKFGPAINVRECLAAHAKPRLAVGAITTDLEARIQSLLDSIGPGRPVETASPASPPVAPRLQAGRPGPAPGGPSDPA